MPVSEDGDDDFDVKEHSSPTKQTGQQLTKLTCSLFPLSGRSRGGACCRRSASTSSRTPSPRAACAGRGSCIIGITTVVCHNLTYSGTMGKYCGDVDDEADAGDAAEHDDGDCTDNWPRNQYGGGLRADARRRPEEHPGNISVRLAEGQHLLNLRGGGATDSGGERARRGPLGAGVLHWLYDSDYENEEAAELERRRNEGLIIGGSRRHEGDDDNTGTQSAPQRATESRPRMRITGRSGETNIRVCHKCMKDVPLACWEAHACTGNQSRQASSTGRVQRMISEWEARSCYGNSQQTDSRSSARTISLAEALGIHDARPPEPGADGGGARVVSIAQALADEPRESPRDRHAPRQWYDRGLAEIASLDVQPGAAADDEQGHRADWKTWSRDACQGCGMTSLQGVREWRICRCREWYCAACASGQCVHCPAARVWTDPEVTGTGDDRDSWPIVDEAQAAAAGDCAMNIAALRWTSPDEAQKSRVAAMKAHKEHLDEKRTHRRGLARVHVRQGLRPGRERNRDGEIVIASANVTCTTSLKDELEHGVELRRVHHILLQEHKLKGDSLDAATAWAAKHGWDAHINEAYIKESRPGGGTAVLSRDSSGVRPMAPPPTELEGRCTMGAIDGNGSIVAVAWYGVTGGCLAQQLPLWQALATLLRMHGLPFVVGGDWQVTTHELRSTGLHELLDARICAGEGSTNLQSGRRIDYFLVSNTLLAKGWRVEHMHGTRFATHCPTVLHLDKRKCTAGCTRLAGPRPLPVHPPVGPRKQQTVSVAWEAWSAIRDAETGGDFDEGRLSAATRTWFAGAELELLDTFDLANEDGISFTGIGLDPRLVQGVQGGRFRHTPDEAGTLGHRITWAIRGMHLLAWHARAAVPDGLKDAGHDVMRRISRRAHAFLREANRKEANGSGRSDDIMNNARELLRKGLRMLVSLTRSVHRHRPLLCKLINGDSAGVEREARDLMHQMIRGATALVASRRKASMRAMRGWARTATLRVTHKVTKPPEGTLRKSASADKGHLGERTHQEAADAGRSEYAEIWRAKEHDGAPEILRAMEAMMAVGAVTGDTEIDGGDRGDVEEAVVLEPWDEEKVLKSSMKFRGDTALGLDQMRPRHVTLLSSSARKALARLLNCIEKLARWPLMLRTVIDVALSKKAGGARLIGLSSSIYRLWARGRYLDCRAVIEARVARPYFAAAPGCGAGKAVFDQTWEAECAHAHGEYVATTIVDFKQYYEHIEVDEVVAGGLRVGLPRAIMLLSAHLYLGPRHIRCGEAVSSALYPRRSVLAGCTWATLIIRIIMAGPTDRFLRMIRERYAEWNARVLMTIYVDDGVVSTRGHRSAVEYLHVWVSKLLLAWIKTVLRKEVAPHKLSVVASTKDLCVTLRKRLGEDGFKVNRAGEMLGTDYAAGGRFAVRRVQVKRRRKMVARRGRIAWWRNLGGDARSAMRGGAWASGFYGCDSLGIPPPMLRDMRQLHSGVSKVRCSGSSLTAKLALGGERHDDIDPSVLYCNPPLHRILAKLWDDPRSRRSLVKTWLKARTELYDIPEGRRWRAVRGPVGAAMLHLDRSGCEWHKPYWIKALHHEINLLEVPPLQVMCIVRAQARLTLDIRLLESLCVERAWETDEILARYKHGIDWPTLRQALNGRSGLQPSEAFALRLVACGGFWAEARKHAAGLRQGDECGACSIEKGTDMHCLHECGSLDGPITLRLAEGRLRKQPKEASDVGLTPLMQMALPPLAHTWRPVEGGYRDGALSQDVGGDTFGDGSGYFQQETATRVATCSVVRLRADCEGRWVLAESSREIVRGWFPTVPRGEISALIMHLQHAGVGATYWGDCKHVIDVANAGVPQRWASSSCANADLWREVRRLLADHGGQLSFRKVAAHRARATAEAEGGASLMIWTGNNAADIQARKLAKSIADTDQRQKECERLREISSTIIDRVGVAAALAIRGRPNLRRRRVGLRDPVTQDAKSTRHLFRRRANGGWECGRCHAYWNCDRARRRAERTQCSGDIQRRVHHSHDVHTVNGVLWCSRCGCYATRWPRKLRLQCSARPMSEAQQNVKRRLQRAQLPTTAEYLATETGFAESTDHAGHGTASGATQTDGKPSGRYLRLVGGPLYRAPGRPRAHSVSPEAIRHGQHHLHHHRPDHVHPDHGRAVSDGEMVMGLDTEAPAGTDGGGERLPSNPPRDGQPREERDFQEGPRDHTTLMSRSGSQGYEEVASGRRRRIWTKSKPEGASAGSEQPVSAERGPVEELQAEPKCSLLAGGSWAARLSACATSSHSECNACGARTRTRCRGCRRPLCIVCARYSAMCGV